jgi:hypothetical protein
MCPEQGICCTHTLNQSVRDAAVGGAIIERPGSPGSLFSGEVGGGTCLHHRQIAGPGVSARKVKLSSHSHKHQ